MSALTVFPVLPWPLSPWALQSQGGPQPRPPRTVAPRQNLQSPAQFQAQGEAEARSEATALWEVMMRPA